MATSPKGRVRSLDGLRALAVLMVFATHFEESRFKGGFLGVDLFFVLSGYLITWLLLNEHRKAGKIAFGAFYARRALRLMPALVATVLFATIALQVEPSLPGRTKDSLFSILYIYDFYGSFSPHLALLGHTWSLAVEEQFYLFWPMLLVLGLAKTNRLRESWLIVIIAAIIGTYVASRHYGVLIQFFPWTHLPELGAGCILALSLNRSRDVIAKLASTPVASVALVVLIVAVFVAKNSDWWVFAVAAIPCVIVVAHLVTLPDTMVSRLFSLRPAAWLGERSYGFYLWHYPILLIVQRHVSGNVDDGVTALSITLVVTEVSWRFIERPFLRLKDRFSEVDRQSSVLDVGPD